jgi:hypothetical protein
MDTKMEIDGRNSYPPGEGLPFEVPVTVRWWIAAKDDSATATSIRTVKTATSTFMFLVYRARIVPFGRHARVDCYAARQARLAAGERHERTRVRPAPRLRDNSDPAEHPICEMHIDGADNEIGPPLTCPTNCLLFIVAPRSL